jgi:hypothetical protein
MSGRTSKLLRRVAKYNNLEYRDCKKWYRNLNQRKRTDLRKFNGQLIILTKEYMENLRMGLYPATNLLDKGEGAE